MKVHEILETCLYVDDLQQAEAFYRTCLGLEVISQVAGRHVFFRCGNRVFLIFNAHTTSAAGGTLPPHGAHGSVHVAFAIREREIADWRSWLQDQGVAIEREVTWPGGGHSIYFRDPAGNSVELATPQLWAIAEDAVFPG